MPKVSVQIVTWNSMNYIMECLESLMKQSFRDFSILVIDNGSDDGTVKFIRSYYPTVSILENSKNLGYSRANNQGIHLAKGEYILVLNPDVILTEDFIQEMVDFADKHREAGSFGGKVLKFYTEIVGQDNESSIREFVKSDFFDSTGLEILKTRKVVDRGQNQKDKGQYEKLEEVFGISGNCVMYRASALVDVMIKNEFFDQDFFAYKEDIDLAWRLRLYGWNSWYNPQAVCYHHRTLGSFENKNLTKSIKQRRHISKVLRSLSFRNHHLMIFKNDQMANIVFHLPWVLGREIKILFYALIFEPFQYSSTFKFFKLLPNILVKRRIIMAHKKISAKEIKKWFR